MIILGVNAFHADAAAAIVIDGRLVAAAEEERFRRIKHWAGFPANAISYCLQEARLSLSDVDYLALNQDSRANLGRKFLYALCHRPNAQLVFRRVANRRARRSAPAYLAEFFPHAAFKGRIAPIEHHRAHLSSAFHVSPFDEAAVVSVDGFGDFASGAWGFGRGTQITEEGKIFFPHSLGIFYQAMTQYLGFPHYGDEYKVMGLAPYGQPSFLPEMRRLVSLHSHGRYQLTLEYFRHHRENISHQWDNGVPAFDDLFSPALENLLGPRRKPGEALTARHFDIARSVQAMYEEAFFHLLDHLHNQYCCPNIALSGGCAANSVANGKIARNSSFRHVYVQAAAGDAGGAIGAAFALWHQHGGARVFAMEHAYWGPHFADGDIAALIETNQTRLAAEKCHVEVLPNEDELCRRTAEAISQGKVVGWFQGRMEWGPRALGNRSILCDPRRADMKDILNAKIKRRESFRPFAPSILEEEAGSWFEENGAVPFMMQVFQIRPEKRALIPAVTHVDGSGRLQTVGAVTNPRYHRLISRFRDLTGIPAVLNTSFNENEPVVCAPAEAIECFLRTRMDMLVLGNTLIARSD